MELEQERDEAYRRRERRCPKCGSADLAPIMLESTVGTLVAWGMRCRRCRYSDNEATEPAYHKDVDS